MTEKKYSADHEWVSLDADGNAVIGISDFAQKELGDIVFVELPELDRVVDQHEEAAVVESVKAASDVKMPISGTVIAINEQLEAEPELINTSPEEDGWFVKLAPSDTDELTGLMDAEAYAAFVENS